MIYTIEIKTSLTFLDWFRIMLQCDFLQKEIHMTVKLDKGHSYIIFSDWLFSEIQILFVWKLSTAYSKH